MKVVPLAITDSRWCDFATSHPSSEVFHLPAWTSVIADCYRFDSFALAALDADGEILGGVPVIAVRRPFGRPRWVSLPFSDACPMLVRTDVPIVDVIAALRDHALASRATELEVRSDLPPLRGSYPVQVGHHHRLELPKDPSDLRPKKNHRNARNRAQRNGIRVVCGATAHDVATYYRLHTLTRRRLGVPVQPRRFFDLIYDRLVRQGNGFVATALLDGDVLASGLYLLHNGTLVAKFGASDPSHQDTGAGYLVDWEVMRTACTEGYHTLDLGRTDLDAEGLRLYKSGWGCSERPLVYNHISSRPHTADRPRVGQLSRRIIRKSPLLVCRALGEVLYRWTA